VVWGICSLDERKIIKEINFKDISGIISPIRSNGDFTECFSDVSPDAKTSVEKYYQYQTCN